MIERLKIAAKNTLARIRAASRVYVVYQDVDTICLRASNGRDITFMVNPEIRDELLIKLSRINALELVRLRRGPPIVGVCMDSLAESGKEASSEKINAASDGDAYDHDIAKYLGISSFEAANMMSYAEQAIINMLVTRGRNAQPARQSPKPFNR